MTFGKHALGLISEEYGLAGRILAQNGADITLARAYVMGPSYQEDVLAGEPSGALGFWSRLFRGREA